MRAARSIPGRFQVPAIGELPARIHAILPLDQAASAHRTIAKGGLRGRYVLTP
jgi:hypothetical protein